MSCLLYRLRAEQDRVQDKIKFQKGVGFTGKSKLEILQTILQESHFAISSKNGEKMLHSYNELKLY